MAARLIVMLILVMSCASPRYTYDFGTPASLTPTTRAEQAPRLAPPQTQALTAVTPATAEVVLRADPPRAKKGVILNPDPVALAPDRVPPPAADGFPGNADAKRSVIFLVGGLIALLIGGQVFYVAGSLSLLIGFIFGIKWLLRK